MTKEKERRRIMKGKDDDGKMIVWKVTVKDGCSTYDVLCLIQSLGIMMILGIEREVN